MKNPFPKAPAIDLPVDYNTISSTYRRLVREEYIRIQEGKCQHCQEPLSGPPALRYSKCWINVRLFPDGFFEHPVHLHHNHVTGLTVGAVHARCNAWLYQYKGE